MMPDYADSDKITLWTRQSCAVLKKLQDSGISRVKSEYIDKKYQEAGWSFKIAYDYLKGEMKKVLPPGEGCESPYWLHASKEGTGIFAESILLEFSVPVDRCFFFDTRDWNRVLNLEYLGSDFETAEFQAELERQGILHASEVFRKPYYPIFKQKIIRSWKKMIKSPEMIEKVNLQAAIWELRLEWLCKVY